jgi:hypothetical protein
VILENYTKFCRHFGWNVTKITDSSVNLCANLNGRSLLNQEIHVLTGVKKFRRSVINKIIYVQYTFSANRTDPEIIRKEVLGRTNRLLSLIRHGPQRKRCIQQFFCCCACIRCHGNVLTEMLPRNDRGI